MITTMKWENFKKEYYTGGHGYRNKWNRIGRGELYVLDERRQNSKEQQKVFGKWYYYWRTVTLRQGNKVKIVIDEELG